MVNYTIIGGGKLARHFSHYFSLLGLPHTAWARDRFSEINTSHQHDAAQRLKHAIADSKRVLLLVSDNAIKPLLKQYPFLHDKQLIHCSGAMSFPGVAGVHPLMTFPDDLYTLEIYQSVPFMLESGHEFTTLFPGLENPHFSIEVENKARYHAMCVAAGNFTQILWRAVSSRFESQLGLPPETLNPYLQQLSENFRVSPENALTGPHSRGDVQTIERNLQSLQGDALQDLYASFTDFYSKEQQVSPHTDSLAKGQVL